MMTGRVMDAAGQSWLLPPLLTWELRRTGGVPCDSFCVRCAWDAETMPDVLSRAVRFAAYRGAALCLLGVIDEACMSLDAQGSVLTLSGRGFAALLLDNEAEAESYQRAVAAELLRRHAEPYGICCEACSVAVEQYTVRSGASEWSVVEEFARLCGLYPWFSREGKLLLRPEGQTGRTVHLSGRPVALTAKENRYGVLSEVLVVDRKDGTKRCVRDEALCALGVQCRRVISVPSQSTAASLRCTGEYQLSQSARQRFGLTAEFAGYLEVDAGERVLFAANELGLTGAFLVDEVIWRGGADGEATVLTLRKE